MKKQSTLLLNLVWTPHSFTGHINNSACHRGAWDMWPTCLCKQRLTAIACLLHLSSRRSQLAVYIVAVLKKFGDSRHLKSKFTHSKVVTPELADLCNQQIRKSVIVQQNKLELNTLHIHTLKHKLATPEEQRHDSHWSVQVVQLSKGNLAHTMSQQWTGAASQSLSSLIPVLDSASLVSLYPPAWPTAQSRWHYNKITFTKHIYVLE